MKPLVIFEIANNHMGELNHGLKIIRTYYNISKNYRNIIDFAVKFQFRDLKTFVNPSCKCFICSIEILNSGSERW